MGLPSKRRTKQSKRERSSHFALVQTGLTTCTHCKKKIRPHRVCPFCGYYKGREIIKKDILRTKKNKKKEKPEDEKSAEPKK